MLEFLKSIDSWVWIVVVMVLYLGFYLYRNIKTYNKNRTKILDFQNALDVGSRVVLNSGIHATIKELNRKTAIVEIAPKIEILIERFSIAALEKEVELESEETEKSE